MNSNQFIKILLNDIKVDLTEEFDKNFERKGFFQDNQWTKKRNGEKSSLIKTGKLRRSIRSSVQGNSIVFTSQVPYADIHNSGGKIRITAKMKRFFWAKHYESGGKIPTLKNGRKSRSKRSIALSQEAEFWKSLALKKIGDFITIPQRQFIGNHPQVKNIIENNVKNAMQNFSKEILKNLKK